MQLPSSRHALALVALACASFAFDTRLDSAEDALRQIGEGACKEGAQLAANVNTAEAADLLLEWIAKDQARGGLSGGHYRDIVFTGLEQLTDIYARKRIEAGLKAFRGDDMRREWCAELLGIYGDPDWAGALIKTLRDKNEHVRAAAALSLGQLRLPSKGELHDEVVEGLSKATEDKHPYVRANAWLGLMRVEPATFAADFQARIVGPEADAAAEVRTALLLELATFPAVDAAALEATGGAALADPDWRVRLRAAHALDAVRTKSNVAQLVAHVADSRPLVAERVMAALVKLTGLGYTKPASWQAWWAANHETFAFPDEAAEPAAAEAGERTVATYNGLEVTSDHVAFVVDKSAAMDEWLDHAASTKDAFAQVQLGQVLESLEGDVRFNVYTYHLDHAVLNKRGPLEVNPKNIKKALKFTEKQALEGSKNIWAVLEAVISDPDIDTVYLLSSGEPDTGKYVHQNRIAPHIRNLNRFHGVTVHTIAYSNRKFFRDQLEAIADATGGDFKWFE